MNAAGIHKAEMILICGKICAGKTTYAKKLMKREKGQSASIATRSCFPCLILF